MRLIFSGELLPGREPGEVKAGLPALMKIPPEQVEKLFAGRPVVIKRGLPESKLAGYRALLEKAGLAVRVEDEMPVPDLSLEPIVAPQPVEPPAEPAPQTSVPQAEEMACPKCGCKQPKRTLCRECGVDMPRYTAAQATAKTEAAAPSPYAATAASTLSRGFSAAQEDLPPVFAFNLDGRLNRVRYLVYGVVMQAVMAIAAFIMIGSLLTSLFGGGGFPIFLTLVFLALMLVMLFVGIRFSVLRLHDMGYTGWLVLLLFVPLIGGFVGLWFLIWPGSKEENQYGLPNPPNSGVHYAILIGGFVLILGIFGLMVRKMVTYQSEMLQMQRSTPYGQGMPPGYPPGGFEQPGSLGQPLPKRR
ncbi:DUF805 domain-containing protein [Formivibrio citricus]|uniref:DUF805 domain-containing protein n=1 Tax=Formivibrio citricus TaxID=83765 RepID=UPI0015A7059B|nr:DUF805 domain-containing protein [Formivibrio citricus]